MEHSQSVMHLLSTVEATFGLSYSIELTLKAKERTGGPNFTLRTLNNAKPYFFLNEMNTKDLPAMYSTAFWCLFVVLLVFLALLRNHCYEVIALGSMKGVKV